MAKKEQDVVDGVNALRGSAPLQETTTIEVGKVKEELSTLSNLSSNQLTVMQELVEALTIVNVNLQKTNVLLSYISNRPIPE